MLKKLRFLVGFLTVFTGAGLGIAQEDSESANKNSEGVAVVLTASTGVLHIPSVEFYRAVKQAIVDGHYWEIVNDKEVNAKLSEKFRQPQSVSNLPIFDKAMWIKGFRQGKNKIVEPLQYMLDSLALDAAIVVDCHPAGDQDIKSCGLHYYDRTRANVQASAEKSFQIPITDATKWAAPLVNGLKQGMVDARRAKEKKQVEEFMQSHDEEERKRDFFVNVSAVGQSFNTRSSKINNHAFLALTPGLQNEGTSLGLEFSYGKTQRGRGDTDEVLETKSLGLSFHVSSKALDIVLWDIGLTGGIKDQKLNADDSGSMRARQPFIDIRPGLYWLLAKGYLLGIDVRFISNFGGTTETSGVYKGDSFPSSSFATGLSFVKVFTP